MPFIITYNNKHNVDNAKETNKQANKQKNVKYSTGILTKYYNG